VALRSPRGRLALAKTRLLDKHPCSAAVCKTGAPRGASN
jgi:hypothetical protein